MPVIFISLTEDEVHRRFTNCTELLDFFNNRTDFSCKLVNEENTLTVCVHDGSAYVRFGHKGRPIQVAVSSAVSADGERAEAAPTAAGAATAAKDSDGKWFRFGSTKTKVKSKYCLDMTTLKKTVEYFFQTGEMYPQLKWEISR